MSLIKQLISEIYSEHIVTHKDLSGCLLANEDTGSVSYFFLTFTGNSYGANFVVRFSGIILYLPKHNFFNKIYLRLPAQSKTMLPKDEYLDRSGILNNDVMKIQSPYNDWDPDRIFISTLEKFTNRKADYSKCQIQYNYKLPSGTEMKGPLLIEFPREKGARCISNYGISEILETPSDTGGAEGNPHLVPRRGTGRYMVLCTLDPTHEQAKALRGVLNDIYDKAITYMEFHGKEGTCILSNNMTHTKPVGLINELNTANHLRYPIWHKETITIDPQGKKIISKDTTAPFTVVLGVGVTGKRATKILDKVGTIWDFGGFVGNGAIEPSYACFKHTHQNKVRYV